MFARRLRWWAAGRSIAAVVATFVLLRYCGLFDHLLATPYSQFEWDCDDGRVRAGELQPLPACPVWSVRADLAPSPDRCGADFVLAVKSAQSHVLLRSAVRRLWGRERVVVRPDGSVFKVNRIFLLGKSQAPADRYLVVGESQLHADILEGDFTDTYENNTVKTMMGMTWLRENCRRVRFFLFVDDDYLVSVSNAVEWLAAQSAEQLARLYAGYRFDSGPFRARWHKHFVSLADYPFDAYPPYISAGAYLLSNESLQSLVAAARTVRAFAFDDVYLGAVARAAAIPPRHNERFRYWPARVDKAQLRSVIAAHGFGDPERMRLAYEQTADASPP